MATQLVSTTRNLARADDFYIGSPNPAGNLIRIGQPRRRICIVFHWVGGSPDPIVVALTDANEALDAAEAKSAVKPPDPVRNRFIYGITVEAPDFDGDHTEIKVGVTKNVWRRAKQVINAFTKIAPQVDVKFSIPIGKMTKSAANRLETRIQSEPFFADVWIKKYAGKEWYRRGPAASERFIRSLSYVDTN